MKRRYIAVTMGILMGMTQMAPAYAAAQSTQSSTQAALTLTGQSADDEEETGEELTEKEENAGQLTANSDEGQKGPSDGSQPPQMPDGQGGPGDGSQPPQMPDGQGGPGDGSQPPQMPGGQGGPGGQMGGPGGSSAPESYSAVRTCTESTQITDEEIVSDGADENALLVDAQNAQVVVKDVSVTRESAESTGGDDASFYGVGAAMLATAGTLYVSDTQITTDAKGGAGLFAYGDGVVCAADTVIRTAQGTSGGIHAAGGGTLYAWDLEAQTQGESSAAIRSDRGGGTMVIDGGSYTAGGTGSPAVYCTADITVHDAALSATGSEAVCIEGLNTLRLFDCDLEGDMPDQDQNDVSWNVIVYQSMSGDSQEGNGTFEMDGGTLTAHNGGMFYTTNTESTITLKNVEITTAQDNPFFLQVTGNTNARGWGEAGNNGADCLFTAIEQEMEGDVVWDSISQLDLYLTAGSALTGAVVQDETWAGEGGSGYCSVYVDEMSKWIVTGDSTLTSLSNAGTIMDADGNAVTIIGTDGTVYAEGESPFTITVSSYSDTADMSGASAISVWEDYEVSRPEEL